MHDVTYYTSGKAAADTKKGLFWLKFIKYPFIGSAIAKKLLEGTREFEPKVLDIAGASELIRRSEKCAVGERVCRTIHNNSEITESVFLDELAEGMVNAGMARYVPPEDAIGILKKYSGNHPLVLSQISKKPVEICCSSVEKCIYWNMQRSNLRVFGESREKQ